jgi:ArsR family transcriptional regulator, arsenate/arsenite/antimonite-responsive transcriptional repressor
MKKHIYDNSYVRVSALIDVANIMTPVKFFKCLSEETRLKSLLLMSLHGELCVCDLIQALKLSQPKISRHLAELRKSGIVLDERRGKWVFYRISEQLPDWAREILSSAAKNNEEYLQAEQSSLCCRPVADNPCQEPL